MLFSYTINVMNMNINTNSKNIKPGDIFVAIKGINNDGHDYIEDAIDNGASYIICEKGEYKIPYMLVPSTEKFLKDYVDAYNNIINEMCIIGITGTNGKTTSCFLIYELLKMLNVKCAYIGTLGFYLEDKIINLNNTTPDLLTLYNILKECKDKAVKVIVMEVSSHALEMNRIYGFKFDYTVFTNLTKDHLDFHLDINNYLNSKIKLFNLIKPNGIGIVNIDDDNSKKFKCKNLKTYGFKNSNYQITSYKLFLNKTIYQFKYNNKKYKVKINAPGKYNIYNSIISIIILNNMGFPINKIIKKLNKVTLPSGRMEIINVNKSYVIIDYAHTPDAVSNVLKNVNEFKKNKVYTIIGCGGNRDKTKRKDMGIISTELSDYVIFTNDNPRSEKPTDIINDITNDLISNNYEVILDRKDAIIKGIQLLDKNDILLILGKGHENYQIINGINYHFNDKEEVLKYIKKIKT